MKKIIILIILVLCTSCTQKIEHTPLVDLDTFTMVFATDIHYLNPSLVEQGEPFDNVIANGDGKVVHYSDQLLDAFIDEMIELRPDFLILTGDLTFNGEKESHVTIASKLEQIESNGVQIYVIPGNHDISNPRSRGYGTEETYRTDSITTKQFQSIYKQYGYETGESIKDPKSLSYLIKLNDNNWMFMLDSNNNTKKHGNLSDISGSISTDTIAWMESLIPEDTLPNIFVSMHHNQNVHSDMINEGFTIDNPSEFRKFINTYDVKALFSGHIHIQSIVENEYVTNSLSTAPNNYGLVTISPMEMKYQTHRLDFTMHDESNFQETSNQYFLDIAYNMIQKNLNDSELSGNDIHNVATVFSELNQYYFAGRIVKNKDSFFESNGYKLVQEIGFFKNYLNAILDNTLDSNFSTIELDH